MSLRSKRCPLCSWHCRVAAASASCREPNLKLMAASFSSKAQLKVTFVKDGPFLWFRHSPLASTNSNRSVTGVRALGMGIPGSILCVCVNCPFPPREIKHRFLQTLEGNFHTPPTNKFKNYYFNNFLEEAAPLGMPLLNGPLWNCSAELLFGMIRKLILRSNWRNNPWNSCNKAVIDLWIILHYVHS